MIVAQMRGGGDRTGTDDCGRSRELDRTGNVGWPVVNPGEEVAVQVDHKRTGIWRASAGAHSTRSS